MDSIIASAAKQSQKEIRLSSDCFVALAMTILISLIPSQASAQTDSIQTRGTIKIGKQKKEKVYIDAAMKIYRYDLSKVNGAVSKDMLYPPFPGVEGYTYPFNYTKYFTENFKGKEIDLRGKLTDTVRIEIKVLANGKVYMNDRTRSTIVKDVPAPFDEKVKGLELSGLQLNCLHFLKEIKTWEPAYVTKPEIGKFKKQTVIKPEITTITASGTLTIVFSYTPFEEEY